MRPSHACRNIRRVLCARSWAFVLPSLALVIGLAFAAAPRAEDPQPQTVDENGTLAPLGGGPGWISGDGRYVVFRASNLLPADTTGNQVYLRDRITGDLELISVTPSGAVSDRGTTLFNGGGQSRYVSVDGRYVLFKSSADDIVPSANDSNLQYAFLRDRQTQTTSLVSVAGDGTPANAGVEELTMDPLGTAVMFSSSATNLDADAPSGGTFLHLPGLPLGDPLRTKAACRDINGDPVLCRDFSLSCNGQLVAFRSSAPNVAPNDPPGNDVFAGLPTAGSNELLTEDVGTVATSRSHGAPSMSCEGNRVAFRSNISLFVGHDDDRNLYVVDWIGGPKYLIEEPDGVSVDAGEVSIASGGTLIVFTTLRGIDPLDTNGVADAYLVELPANAAPPYKITWESHYQDTPPDRTVSGVRVSTEGVVVFSTGAFNPPWPATNGFDHVYVRQVKVHVVFDNGFE